MRHQRQWEVTARRVVLCMWLGLSQREAAAKLGMSTCTYREWEPLGRRQWQRVQQSPAAKLRVATGVSLDWLRSRRDEPYNSAGRGVIERLPLSWCMYVTDLIVALRANSEAGP